MRVKVTPSRNGFSVQVYCAEEPAGPLAWRDKAWFPARPAAQRFADAIETLERAEEKVTDPYFKRTPVTPRHTDDDKEGW